MRPQAFALIPIALFGFGGGYLLGRPGDTPTRTSRTSIPVPARFDAPTSQQSIAGLGTAAGYPPLARPPVTRRPAHPVTPNPPTVTPPGPGPGPGPDTTPPHTTVTTVN
jgi:hypothetical protein